MQSSHLPWILGGGLLFLATRKKAPSHTEHEIRVAQSILISRQARDVAASIDSLPAEEKLQLGTLRQTLAASPVGDACFILESGVQLRPFIGDVAPRSQRRNKKRTGSRRRRGHDAVGAPPYSPTNPPTPMEVAILYSIDPNFLIRGTESDQTVAQLAVKAAAVQPTVVEYAKEKNPARLIENGLSILSTRQLREFSLAVVTDQMNNLKKAMPSLNLMPYHLYLEHLESMLAYKEAKGEIIDFSFREPEAVQLKQEADRRLLDLSIDNFRGIDPDNLSPDRKKRYDELAKYKKFDPQQLVPSEKKPAFFRPIDQMMIGLFDLVWEGDPFATVTHQHGLTMNVLREAQSVARETALRKSNAIVRVFRRMVPSSLPSKAEKGFWDKAAWWSDRIFDGPEPEWHKAGLPAPTREIPRVTTPDVFNPAILPGAPGASALPRHTVAPIVLPRKPPVLLPRTEADQDFLTSIRKRYLKFMRNVEYL